MKLSQRSIDNALFLLRTERESLEDNLLTFSSFADLKSVEDVIERIKLDLLANKEMIEFLKQQIIK